MNVVSEYVRGFLLPSSRRIPLRRAQNLQMGESVAADEVFTVHDAYDYAHASDGQSRYRAYLARNIRRFRDGRGEPSAEPAVFAAAAFVIASAPIMSPPYVSTHPRAVFAAPRWDADRRCALLIELATPLPPRLADRLPSQFGGWERDQYTGRYHHPEDNDQPAAYSRLLIRIPLPIDLLPAPVYTPDGVADVDTAKRAIRTMCAHANSILTHLIVNLGGTNDDDLSQQWLSYDGPPSSDREDQAI